MSDKGLAVTSEELEPGTRIFRLSGRLYGTHEGYAFQEDVRKTVNSGTKRIIVELSETDRIDSCGIGILAAIAVSGQNAGAAIVVASLPEKIRDLLSMAWFLNWVDHADSVEEARTKLAEMEAKRNA